MGGKEEEEDLQNSVSLFVLNGPVGLVDAEVEPTGIAEEVALVIPSPDGCLGGFTV